MCWARDASGVTSPKTCPLKARCIVISATGGMTVRWIASITCCTSNAARNSNVKLAPRRASLIVRASKALKRGAQIDPHGFDAGKLIKGKKRHILVDTEGLLLHGIVTSASVQDRDGGIMLLSTLFGMFPFLEKLFADSAYEGPIFHTALALILPPLTTEIVKRSDQAKGFVVLPKRWIVDRTIAWLNRCRRLAKDWENLNLSALIFLRLASIRLMLRKLCNPSCTLGTDSYLGT